MGPLCDMDIIRYYSHVLWMSYDNPLESEIFFNATHRLLAVENGVRFTHMMRTTERANTASGQDHVCEPSPFSATTLNIYFKPFLIITYKQMYQISGMLPSK